MDEITAGSLQIILLAEASKGLLYEQEAPPGSWQWRSLGGAIAFTSCLIGNGIRARDRSAIRKWQSAVFTTGYVLNEGIGEMRQKVNNEIGGTTPH